MGTVLGSRRANNRKKQRGTRNRVLHECTRERSVALLLAVALLASQGGREAQERVRKDLADDQRDWYALRALRIVPLQFTAPMLCSMVERGQYSDETYDAIVALGRLPHNSSRAAPAAQALSSAIDKMRGKPWHDGMRTRRLPR